LKTRLLFLIIILLTLAACTNAAPTPTPAPTRPPTATATPAPTATVTPTATPTALPPLIILLRPADAAAALADPLEAFLHDTAETAGMRWQVRPALTAKDVPAEAHLLVILPGAGVDVAGVSAIAAAVPDARILCIGIPGLAAAANLTTVQLGSGRPDQLGFIAGFIAAMLTPDYRSGMVGLSDDAAAKAAYHGFLNGDTYYCGLCLQSYPPFYSYPLYVEAAANADATTWWGNGEFLKDHQAETVFIYPGAGDEAMLRQLAEQGIRLIGTQPPSEELRPAWVASLRTDPLPTILALIPQILAGQGGQEVTVPLQISDVNGELLSPGRLRYANEVLADLLAGFTDTGVDPLTGEIK
jgi:hypothetical protein